MNNEQDFSIPSALVIEYKSTSLVIGGVLSIIAIVALTIFTKALSNIILIIALGIWLVVALTWLKKAFLETALIITDKQIKINDKHTIEWHTVDNFYIKTIVWDDGNQETLIINTKKRDFKFDLAEVDIDKERLNRWIKFYKQSQRKGNTA